MIEHDTPLETASPGLNPTPLVNSPALEAASDLAASGQDSQAVAEPAWHVESPREEQPTEGQLAAPPRPAPTPRKNDATSSYVAPTALHRISWMMLGMAVLMVTFSVVPSLVKRTSYAWHLGKQRAEQEVAAERLQGGSLADLSQAYQLVSRRVGPSVVHINVVNSSQRRLLDPAGGQSRSRGQGSGVIVDRDGYVLTNFHVIEDAAAIEVSLNDGRVVGAQVVGVPDALTDLAVLKIEAGDLTPIEWGNSDELDVGGMVWALGSPFGLERSITFGIVSAKHRSGRVPDSRPHQDLLQTDAAVNPGNSGGPLVDAHGRLVGINTAIVGESYQGISFAVPSNVAHTVFDRLRKYGRFDRGYLGIQPVAVSPPLAKELKLPDTRGAYVYHVTRDESHPSPAQVAGIAEGDVIVDWNGNPVAGPADLFGAIGETPIGSVARIRVFRAGEELELEVLVGSRPPEPKL